MAVTCSLLLIQITQQETAQLLLLLLLLLFILYSFIHLVTHATWDMSVPFTAYKIIICRLNVTEHKQLPAFLQSWNITQYCLLCNTDHLSRNCTALSHSL